MPGSVLLPGLGLRSDVQAGSAVERGNFAGQGVDIIFKGSIIGFFNKGDMSGVGRFLMLALLDCLFGWIFVSIFLQSADFYHQKVVCWCFPSVMTFSSTDCYTRFNGIGHFHKSWL
jgi:hypothetical protein